MLLPWSGYFDCRLSINRCLADAPMNILKSSGCVTHAAIQLALPPNQKGYWIVFFPPRTSAILNKEITQLNSTCSDALTFCLLESWVGTTTLLSVRNVERCSCQWLVYEPFQREASLETLKQYFGVHVICMRSIRAT